MCLTFDAIRLGWPYAVHVDVTLTREPLTQRIVPMETVVVVI